MAEIVNRGHQDRDGVLWDSMGVGKGFRDAGPDYRILPGANFEPIYSPAQLTAIEATRAAREAMVQPSIPDGAAPAMIAISRVLANMEIPRNEK